MTSAKHLNSSHLENKVFLNEMLYKEIISKMKHLNVSNYSYCSVDKPGDTWMCYETRRDEKQTLWWGNASKNLVGLPQFFPATLLIYALVTFLWEFPAHELSSEPLGLCIIQLGSEFSVDNQQSDCVVLVQSLLERDGILKLCKWEAANWLAGNWTGLIFHEGLTPLADHIGLRLKWITMLK